MAKEKFKNAYSDHERLQFATTGESLTQQHFAQEADIKNIIKKHDRTGIIEHVARGVAQYGDYSEVNEYRESMDIVNKANASFQTLPSQLRAMFSNDPGEFFEFATDPANAEKMVRLGLAEAPPIVQPEDAPAKKPAAPAAEATEE